MSIYEEVKTRLGYAATVGETGIIGAVDFARESGFGAVELNTNVPVFFPERYARGDREMIQGYAADSGVALSLHAPEDICLLNLHEKVRRAGLDRMKEVIDFAGDIGAGRVTIHIGASVYFTMVDGRLSLHTVYPELYRRILREELAELRDYAAGKTFPCIENVDYFGRAVVQETLAEMLPQGGLYLTWDWGHSYNNPEQENFMLQYAAFVRNCHVHDHNGEKDHIVVGDGKVDFERLFTLLKDNDANFIFEVRPREKACQCRERLARMTWAGAK